MIKENFEAIIGANMHHLPKTSLFRALYNALTEGEIAGVVLVFKHETASSDNSLLKLGSVVVSPQISSASLETRSECR